MCHFFSPLLDLGDLDPGERLAMAHALAVAGLVLVLDDLDLRTLAVSNDLCGHSSLEILAEGDGFAVNERHGLQFDRLADLALELVHEEDVPNGHLLLTA